MFMKMQTRVVGVDAAGHSPILSDPTIEGGEDTAPCPRCSNDAPGRLEKADPQANTCYRCRTCGHIFSPHD